jgi:hypothetical protein
MKDKVILVDCDGVLLDWYYSFTQWMERHGYGKPKMKDGKIYYDITTQYQLKEGEGLKLIRIFNESAWIRKLTPLRDSIKYVKKLHQDHGYVFHAITSLSNDPYVQSLRTKNLIDLFGSTVFERFTYLDTCGPKDEALLPYKDTGCFWVEDKSSNAQLGYDLGLDPILMKHPFNLYDEPVDARKVNNWKEIYEIITG